MKLSKKSKLDTQTNIETNSSLKYEENYKLFQKKEIESFRMYLKSEHVKLKSLTMLCNWLTT